MGTVPMQRARKYFFADVLTRNQVGYIINTFCIFASSCSHVEFTYATDKIFNVLILFILHSNPIHPTKLG
jgi:hypothetical protein